MSNGNAIAGFVRPVKALEALNGSKPSTVCSAISVPPNIGKARYTGIALAYQVACKPTYTAVAELARFAHEFPSK